jgi:pyrroline-5-carboxylate reductase
MRKTLTFIGNGAMALSLAKGLKKDFDIEVVGRDMKKLEAFETALALTCKKNLLDGFDITDRTLIFCVKPANVEEVGNKLQGSANTLYSVLAGTSLQKLSENIQASHYVRSMPNLAATVSKSMTTLTGDFTCKDDALNIFNAIGTTLWVNSEKELDIATALAGSGPAYLALIAEALADGAVKQGLRRDDAMSLMRGLFEGFGSLIQNEHPALLKDGVMSPGGTTAAGYSALEKANVRDGCMNAVEAAYTKTKIL